MPQLPEPLPLADDGEYQVTDGAFVHLVPIVGGDGWVREVKARFTNRAVLRMTLAQPYEYEDDRPLTGESSAGPMRT
jgi:hypothetical protein